MSWREGLNKLQRTSIENKSDNSVVVAGPGTGKTRTLLGKALQGVEDENVSADQLRIANFTNAGINDLRKKLSETAFSSIKPQSASTFHSLALRILRVVSATSVPNPLVILDDWEEHTFADQWTKRRLGIRDIRVAERLRENYNSRWCIASEDPIDWFSQRDRRKYEAAYNSAKDILGFTTRGELTFLWWRYLRANVGLSHMALGFPWKHLLVDEYQDLNECEHEILQYLGQSGVKIFAVGDPNQSIYETLRHAHPQNCWTFPGRFSSAKLHILEESYRCPAEVLLLGRALLGDVKGVPDPQLAKQPGEAHILSFSSDTAERSGFARIAQALIKGYPTSRVLLAVPGRRLANEFDKELSQLGVPVDNRTRAADEVADMCRLSAALLRLLKQPEDSVAAATAIILVCAPSVRAKRVAELLSFGHKSGLRIARLLVDDVSLPTPLMKAKGQVNKMVHEIKSSANPPATLAELTGCKQDDSTGNEQDGVEEVETIPEEMQLAQGRVTVLTLHASKGTEAEWVLIPAIEPGFFERDLVGVPKEERRRLLYVGMTRAIQGLFLGFASRRYGPTRYGDPTGPSANKGSSVFLDEMCDRSGRTPEAAITFLPRFLA